MNVLFVCTGNTCRSPLAEALARAEANTRGLEVTAGSAGTFATVGTTPALHAVRVGSLRGADLGAHRSRVLTADLLAGVDLAVAMSPSHLEAIRHLAPDVPSVLATDFLPPDDPRHGRPVPDPYGADEAVYETVAVVLEACVTGLLDRVSEEE